MITITGTIRLPPQNLLLAIPAMAQMVAASRAEPGCLGYSYAQDILEPGLFHVVEHWADRDALARHCSSPHLLAWRAQYASIGLHDRNLQLIEGVPEPA